MNSEERADKHDRYENLEMICENRYTLEYALCARDDRDDDICSY